MEWTSKIYTALKPLEGITKPILKVKITRHYKDFATSLKQAYKSMHVEYV